MSQPFNTETKNYGESRPADTPYQRVKKIWDERLGSSLMQAKNWRLIAIINGIVTLILLVLLVSILASHRNTLFIAEVTQNGHVRNVALLKKKYDPTIAQKEYFIIHFIEMIRGVPLDPVVAKKEWTSAYAFLTKRSAKRLTQQWQKNNPLAMLGKKTVRIAIRDVNPISHDTFHVTWKETSVDINGMHPSTAFYNGVFTTTVVQPTTQREIMHNPLGIYILEFNVSKSRSEHI